MDCVPVVLDGTLEVIFLWVLRGMVVSGMVGSRLSRYIVRSVRIYFSNIISARKSFIVLVIQFSNPQIFCVVISQTLTPSGPWNFGTITL